MRNLLERTDRIDGDFVLAGHAVKQLLGTFQCACAQHLGQFVGGLIEAVSYTHLTLPTILRV